MSEPRFKVGDLVRVHASADLGTMEARVDDILRYGVLGIYEVTALAGDIQGEPRYRLSRGASSVEREEPEGRLYPPVRVPQPRR